MGNLELVILAIGLSMDASAVAITNVLCHPLMKWKQCLMISLTFGIFQGIMPVLGYFSANLFASYIQTLDHWVAFVLLVFLGGKMIFGAMRNHETTCQSTPLTVPLILLQAIATSIDAFAVGISFSALKVPLESAMLWIIVITFLMCVLASRVAIRFGSALGNKAQWVGGIILVGIGIKILCEHMLF